MSQECNRSHTSAPGHWFLTLFIMALFLFFWIYTGPASRVSQSAQEREYQHELEMTKVQSGVLLAHEGWRPSLEEVQARMVAHSELQMRSMPFWGQVHVASTNLRPDLRRVNEEVRKEALDWILDQGASIAVVDMTSHWHAPSNHVRFVVTIYYVEEGK